ncbi:ALF repeat-containing protein, partial [Kitasatospora nipponensis]|uniref:ALF repeat-containing protein n=1 Tax=Kitasatospora nipponensis TaxID=258049 RepID=UPI0031DD36AC
NDLRRFLTEGQYIQRNEDEQVQLARILSVGGPAVQKAGRIALNGSADDIREFLKEGQHVARARDQEYETGAQLIRLLQSRTPPRMLPPGRSQQPRWRKLLH